MTEPSDNPANPYSPYREQLEYALGIPFTDGNAITALQNGDEIFAAMLDAISMAEQRIDFLTFVYWTGQIAEDFAEALAERAQAGVRVRVLLDAYGAKAMPAACLQRMQEAGVTVHWFRPLATWRIWQSDKRTHRKILVIDDHTGFTGGVGIAQEWTGDARHPGEWRDTHFKIVGPAIAGLKAAFLDNWNEASPWEIDPPLLVPSPVPDGVPIQIVRACSTVGWTDMATLLRSLASIAQSTLTIVTPYFAPDEKLIALLAAAAERGVTVRIMMPGKHCDMRLPQLAGYTSVEELLGSGVQFYRYERSNLHAKLILVDGVVSCVGSANLNHRSMGKDEECCAVALSESLTANLLERFEEDLKLCTPIDAQQWRTRSWATRTKERLSRLLLEQV